MSHRGVGAEQEDGDFLPLFLPQVLQEFSRYIAPFLPCHLPTVRNWSSGLREDRSRQELFSHCCKGGWTSFGAKQLLLHSIPCFPWEQYLEDSSTIWTIFLVAFSRRRAGRVCFMRKLMQYICSLLCTPFRQHYRIIFLINAFVVVKEAKQLKRLKLMLLPPGTLLWHNVKNLLLYCNVFLNYLHHTTPVTFHLKGKYNCCNAPLINT